MKQTKNMIMQRLSAANPAAPEPQSNPANDPEIDALVEEITGLIAEGKIPEGFDFASAAGDPELANLMREYGAEAGIRIYAAEQRAKEAERSAMERMSARVRERGSLPKSSRGGSAAPGSTNYRTMSSEAFRELMQQMKKTARGGGRTRL